MSYFHLKIWVKKLVIDVLCLRHLANSEILISLKYLQLAIFVVPHLR